MKLTSLKAYRRLSPPSVSKVSIPSGTTSAIRADIFSLVRQSRNGWNVPSARHSRLMYSSCVALLSADMPAILISTSSARRRATVLTSCDSPVSCFTDTGFGASLTKRVWLTLTPTPAIVRNMRSGMMECSINMPHIFMSPA